MTYRRFVDIMSENDGDVRILDFDKFHDTIPDPALA